MLGVEYDACMQHTVRRGSDVHSAPLHEIGGDGKPVRLRSCECSLDFSLWECPLPASTNCSTKSEITSSDNSLAASR